MEELREPDAEFPAHIAEALLVIAQDEGISQHECAAQLGLGKSGIQRAYARLGCGDSRQNGIGRIEVRAGMTDRGRQEGYQAAEG
jgi:hypothetical protein